MFLTEVAPTGIAGLIADLGFPIFICIGLGFYLLKQDKSRLQLESEKDARNHEHNLKLIESIEHYRTTSNQLMEINRELAESNRRFSERIVVKIDNIEHDVLEIKKEVEK